MPWSNARFSLTQVPDSQSIILIIPGHAGQPDQLASDGDRCGGHADHGGVHPLCHPHVHHGGQIRALGAEGDDDDNGRQR